MMDISKNLLLWDKVKHVDEKATKQANVDGNNLTSINTLYPIKLFTQAMGPIGVYWKYDIHSERLDNTKPMLINSEIVLDGGNIVWEQTHTIILNFYIRYGEKEDFQCFQHFGHTKYRYVTNAGKIMIDHEYAKKSVSDALKKCLSIFGVCADVYGGEFENREYKESVQAKIALEKADESAEEMEKQKAELISFIKEHKSLLEQVPEASRHGAIAIKNKVMSHLHNRASHVVLGPIALKGIGEVKALAESKWGIK